MAFARSYCFGRSHVLGRATLRFRVLPLTLVLVAVFVFGVTSAPSGASRLPGIKNTTGPIRAGPGIEVANPPESQSRATLTSGETGTCEVPIENTYDRFEWKLQAKCAAGWVDGQLVTI
jgi:hypothetical protein